MNNKIKNIINNSIKVKKQILQNENIIDKINKSVKIITKTFKGGGKILFCGNGGSAADAQHLAAEFSGRFYIDRKALNAEALHCNTSYLTAVANDYSYDLIYSRLIEGIANKGDVLVGLTTSGNSKNIINAFKIAKEMSIKTIAFTGETGGLIKEVADVLINVPSIDTPRIQESHILLGHVVCELVEYNLFKNKLL